MSPESPLNQIAMLFIALVIAGAVLAFLHTMANTIRNEAELHLLRVRVGALRAARIIEIRRLHGLDEDEPDVDILDEDTSANPEPLGKKVAGTIDPGVNAPAAEAA